MNLVDEFCGFIRNLYGADTVPLHEPFFDQTDNKALSIVMDSSFVSTAGVETGLFEQALSTYYRNAHIFATNTGTAALHLALLGLGVRKNDLVITQPLSFAATCNAIVYCGASPCFIDVGERALSIDVEQLRTFLATQTDCVGGECIHRESGRRISACVPVHVFGHTCNIDAVVQLCNDFSIPVMEDAAEGLGSEYKQTPLGLYGKVGVLSFNGNKIVTAAAGGAVISDDGNLIERIRHLGTTAKQVRHFEIEHDAIGYNYQMPSLNAALGRSQLAKLPRILAAKRRLAETYLGFFADYDAISVITETPDAYANYWLNCIILPSLAERNAFLEATNSQGIITRPLWRPLSTLAMFKDSVVDSHKIAKQLHESIVCLPSSVPRNWLHET